MLGISGKSGRTADLASGKRAWQDSSRCNTLDMLNYAWDEGKASSKDSVDPERILLVGMSGRQRLVLVVHADVDESTIRIISARLATAKERRRYEEGPSGEGTIEGLLARDSGSRLRNGKGPPEPVPGSGRRRRHRPRSPGSSEEGYRDGSHGPQVDPVSASGVGIARGPGQVRGTDSPLGASRGHPRVGEARDVGKRARAPTPRSSPRTPRPPRRGPPRSRAGGGGGVDVEVEGSDTRWLPACTARVREEPCTAIRGRRVRNWAQASGFRPVRRRRRAVPSLPGYASNGIVGGALPCR